MIADLLRQIMKLFTGTIERPSPADIVPASSITYDYDTGMWKIDTRHLNIPFTVPPNQVPLFEIPDTNSMDGIMDEGNNNLMLQPANVENDKIMVDWIAQTWLESKGLQTVDCVYRVMVKEVDDPLDFLKPALWYAIHRLVKVGVDSKGRYFIFRGTNNAQNDPYKARDANILFLKFGTID